MSTADLTTRNESLIRWVAFGLAFLMGLSARAQTTQPSGAMAPTAYRAVVISIDGGRPDLLLRGNCPNIRAMLQRGAYTFWAKTTAVSITLPSHVSMMTGVSPRVHGIEWNSDLPLSRPVYPAVPTLFEVAKKAGYTTAMVAGKSKFNTMNKPGTIDFVSVPTKEYCPDDEVAANAVEVITSHQPQVLFVHFPGADVAGHALGWGSKEQVAVIENIDADIGKVLKAIDDQKLTDSTYVIVTADHGGAGKTHGPEDARSRTIPWILVGPGVRVGLDLSTDGHLDVKTEDTFATVAALLKIPTRPVEGVPVVQAMDRKSLLQDAPAK